MKPTYLTAEQFEQWEERAAIMEYDAGMARKQAEAEALKDILKQGKRQEKRSEDR